ncbi:MAG TPA: ABC transporter transmembrane domain-containing protein, partial [Paracoccaceae bacterium]|nr:ABC transporter transmembrane domain-containing protein [Paracoccaceae bacterium]
MAEQLNSDRPPAKSLKPLRMLVPFLRPYKGTLVAALGALLVASAAVLALPVALRYLIDNGFVAKDVETVNRYFAWFFAAAVAFGGFGALRFYLVTWLGERVVADIRNAVYRRVIHMDPTFFEVTRTGEVLSRLTTDTTLVQSVSGVSLSIALRSSLNLIGGTVMLMLTSLKMTSYILVGVPLFVLPVIIVGRRIRNLSRKAQDRVADTSGLAGETLNAMQTVQSFTLEGLQIERYGEAIKRSFQAAVKRIRVRAGLTAMGIIFVFGAITMILWGGSRAVLAGDMSGGQLAQFLMYSIFVGSSAAALSELWGEIQRGAGAMERLAELLQATPAIAAPAHPAALRQPVKGAIH